MIRSFRDRETQKLFETRKSRKWSSILAPALRRLDQIEASASLKDLQIPPGNKLELLKGNRAGQHSIRINEQYRICFIWKKDGAHEVEVTDYH